MMTADQYRTELAAHMSEAALLEAVRRIAKATGWLAYHTHRSDRSEPGFPDLVLTRHRRLIFAELKAQRGRLTHPQQDWQAALDQTAAEVYVWRPTDYLDDTIGETLNRQSPPITSPPTAP